MLNKDDTAGRARLVGDGGTNPEIAPAGVQGTANDDVAWAQHDASVEERYAGQWVVPWQRRIVAHSSDLAAVLEEAARLTNRNKEELVACAIPHPHNWLADG